jgi:hypothetical protein
MYKKGEIKKVFTPFGGAPCVFLPTGKTEKMREACQFLLVAADKLCYNTRASG